MIDLPAGPIQEYIRIAGIAAVYVASLPSGACQIGVARDLRRTILMRRQQGDDFTIVDAFWAATLAVVWWTPWVVIPWILTSVIAEVARRVVNHRLAARTQRAKSQ